MAKKTLTFTVDKKGKFKYDPPDTFEYNRTDTIEVTSKSGRFTFKFINVDSGGKPGEHFSPLKNGKLAMQSKKKGGKWTTGEKKISNDPDMIAAGRSANLDKVAGYRYAIACQKGKDLFVDASLGGKWTC